MSDNRSSRPWIRRPGYQILLALLLVAVWSVLANQWHGKGCDLMPQSYELVISHGTPDHWEGCESEPDGPIYTDEYGRW